MGIPGVTPHLTISGDCPPTPKSLIMSTPYLVVMKTVKALNLRVKELNVDYIVTANGAPFYTCGMYHQSLLLKKRATSK